MEERGKNVSHLHQAKGSAVRVSIRAYLSSNETLCDGGGWCWGRVFDSRSVFCRPPPTSSRGSRHVAAHSTLLTGDL